MRHQKQPPPNAEQLERAFRMFQTVRPHEWFGPFEMAMADPLRERLVRARAAMIVNEDDKRARSQIPVRKQCADGRWITQMQVGPRTPQLALPEAANEHEAEKTS
jgi:hypothetical protein